ncbi:MAG TPA: phenylalanine--tRNA ligase subunit beta [Actinomycetota bacterium]|nr:phenylalanine--tRNA ligase subunit beta [Actinomycetota bacterium]
MRIPVAWLRELVPTELGVEELAERLTRRGVKVEGIVDPWSGLHGVRLVEVLDVRDHPGSDTLCVARIRHAEGESELVVGVRNMRPGDLVPWAAPGSRVPVLDAPLEARAIRGVVSNGMLCSPRELGLGPDHEGILIVGEPELGVGTDLKHALGLDEPILDVEVEPNRPDFLSVLGVARETAAETGVPLREPPVTVEEVAERADDVASVRIEAAEGCPRYVARIVRGVETARSPLRVQARLVACGMRPISAIVDATNYVMLERGQPLHAFDMDRVAGPGIVVRYATEGERLTTLDDVGRTLTAQDLLICDAERPVALAGVMGGATSEVSDATRNVLLESAFFTREGVLRTARRLDLHTEASHRFERGTDREGLDPAAARCASLLAGWTGGSVLAGTVCDGVVRPRRWVSMRPSRASALLGYDVAEADAVAAFDQLGLAHRTDGDVVEVEVPGYRVDIDREVDLVEEVVRVQGYDHVGSRLPRAAGAGGMSPQRAFARRMKDVLASAGLREIRPAPFASAADLALFDDTDAVPVANPLRAEEGYLRTRLAPGLLRAIARNQALGVRSVGLFEIGTVFRLGDPFDEHVQLAFALAGPAAEGWHTPERPFDVLDARGVLEVVADALGVARWSLGDPLDGPLHPGRSAAVLVDDRPAGFVGELHPRASRALEIEGRAAIAEIDVGAIRDASIRLTAVRDVPRVPPLRRDLAFVVPIDVPAGAVASAIRHGGGDVYDAAVLFDVYEGPPLPDGRKSLAYAVAFRAPDRTLEADEIEPVIERIAAGVRELGGELRAG